jgi:hypothetical protein
MSHYAIKPELCDQSDGVGDPDHGPAGGADSDPVGLPDVMVQPEGLAFWDERYILASSPSVAICQYDVREFAGPSLLEAIKAHPDVSELGFVKFVS